MYTRFSKLALASAIALSIAAAGSPVAAADTTQAITDARQEAQIWTTYVLSPYLRANDISVSVHDGKATLTGTVEEDVNKDLAKQIALGVDGIKSVDNQIVVKADYVAPERPAERHYGESVDDASISAAIKSKLLWSRHTDGLNIEVKTAQGKVTLDGTAKTQEAKTFASRLAMNTRGVHSVSNRLTIDEQPSASDAAVSSAQEVGRDIADSWITTKVKSTFMYSSTVNSSDITVSTDAGVVTLTGTVSSGAERALAIEFAQNVRGVKSVNSKGLKFEEVKLISTASN